MHRFNPCSGFVCTLVSLGQEWIVNEPRSKGKRPREKAAWIRAPRTRMVDREEEEENEEEGEDGEEDDEEEDEDEEEEEENEYRSRMR